MLYSKTNCTPCREAYKPKQLIAEWLLWVVPAYSAMLIILSGHYLLSMDNEKQYALHNERVIVTLIEEILGDTLVQMSADSKNLTYVVATSIAKNSHPFPELKDYFVQLSTNNHSYDQIRFLDNKGQEQLRVNNQEGHVTSVPMSELQNKAHRYYWKHTMSLKQGEVYISPLDFNIERKEVQHPLNPTIRVGAPVFGIDGKKIGVIILNYKGNLLINKLITIAPSFSNHLYLYNPQGIAVIHPNKGKGSHFAVKDKPSLPSEVFNWIQSQKLGQYQLGNSYYTFSKVTAPNEGNWTIVSQFPTERFSLSRQAFYRNYLALYLILIIVITTACFIFSRFRLQARQLKSQQKYELQFRQTLENVQLAAVTIDNQGTVTFCNDYFLKMVGFKNSDVIGHRWVEKFIPRELKEQATRLSTKPYYNKIINHIAKASSKLRMVKSDLYLGHLPSLKTTIIKHC
ncbi:PAS domain S-box protein [Vibrio sonorensis]|uniref:PAS domain S-box protein n=1 Tax=Vibrio sonorensis TaxID=1004316 RepID=UPI000A4C21FD|nr:PAS domain S-box protein [Vibrio sonorensis]